MTNQEYIQNEYLKNRYMKDLSDEDFMHRFNIVLENLCFINDSGKLSIGRINDKRQLFWMHHWIQICAEAELRTIFANQISNVYLTEKTHTFLKKLDINKLIAIRKKSSGNNYLYKFGKETFLKQLIEKGEILLRPASFYSDSSLNSAIKDDELNRLFRLNSKYQSINLQINFSTETHFLYNSFYKKKLSSDYYIYCLADSFEPRLFNDFDADTCLIIKDPINFISRMRKSLPTNIFQFYHKKINYFDPLLDDPFETSLIFSKNFAYSYQNEYRIAFIPFDKNKTLDPTIIKIGDISYISEIVKII